MKVILAIVVMLGLIGAGTTAVLLSVAGVGSVSGGQCTPQGGMQAVVDGALPQDVVGYSDAQLRNAAVIIQLANDRGVGVQGARVALITAMQESNLRNLANEGKFTYPAGGSSVMTPGEWQTVREQVKLSLTLPNDGTAPGDWDSIGAFQGRLSAGWGGTGTTEEQVANLLNVSYTAGRFFDALEAVDGWQDMRPTVAAQRVQRSAFPDAYEKHWENSGLLVEALTGVDVSLISAGPCMAEITSSAITAGGWTKPITSYNGLTSAFGNRFHPTLDVWRLHAGQDIGAAAGTPIFAAAGGVVVKAGRASSNPESSDDLQWVWIDHGGGVETAYLHSEADGILVKTGQTVTAGQQIALVGSSGQSTGPHLHFEVRVDGAPIEPMAYLLERGVAF